MKIKNNKSVFVCVNAARLMYELNNIKFVYIITASILLAFLDAFSLTIIYPFLKLLTGSQVPVSGYASFFYDEVFLFIGIEKVMKTLDTSYQA